MLFWCFVRAHSPAQWPDCNNEGDCLCGALCPLPKWCAVWEKEGPLLYYGACVQASKGECHQQCKADDWNHRTAPGSKCCHSHKLRSAGEKPNYHLSQQILKLIFFCFPRFSRYSRALEQTVIQQGIPALDVPVAAPENLPTAKESTKKCLFR